MNWKHRAVRLVAALTIAGIIGAQIPSNSGVALAQRDDYPEAEESGGGEAARVAAIGAGVLGVASIIGGSSGGGLGGGTAGGGVLGGPGGVGVGPQVVPPVPLSQPIWDVANTSTGELDQFARLSEAGGYKDELRKDGQFTAFIPTNGAFDQLGAATLAELTAAANQTRLGQLVASHVIIGRKTIDELRREATAAGVDGVQYDTINGRKLRVTIDANQVLRVNGVIIRESDVPASNGIIHPILGVIDPDAPGTPLETPAPTAPAETPPPAPAPEPAPNE